jgi:RNA polymerase sigma factor (sigma-70 family)
MQNAQSNDVQLLRQYAQEASQEAFSELVRRHYPWVRAAAARQVRSAAMADDVAQAVFIVLARKAPSLVKTSSLTAWLFQVTRYAASNAIRSERRRQLHERKAAEMQTATLQDQSPQWEQLSGDLDELVAKLRPHDRQALLLRFYQQMSFPQMGSALGISEDAARKRVEHAVERLRALYERRRIAVPATVLGAALFAHAAGAPAHASVMTSVALAATGAAPPALAIATLAAQTIRTMGISIKIAAVVTACLLAVGLMTLPLVARNAAKSANSSGALASRASTSQRVLSPARGVVFDSSMWWSSWWAGAGRLGHGTDTSAAALDLSGPHPRFIVGEKGKWHVWVAQLAMPVDTTVYPILKVDYRASNVVADFAPSRYVIWMDDGTGPNIGGLYYFPPTELIVDGQAHTFAADMRKRDMRQVRVHGPIQMMALGVGCGDASPAVFELMSLRFEKPDGAADAKAPLEDDAPIAVHVADADGSSLSGATVTADAERANFTCTATTDAGGNATMTPLRNESGRHLVRVEHDGYCAAVVDAVKGQVTKVILERATSYGGVVRDAAGKPIAGAFVTVNEHATPSDGRRSWSQAITDSAGRWKCEALPVFQTMALTIAVPGQGQMREEIGPDLLPGARDASHVTTFAAEDQP